jgi:hypothetical protein
MKSDDVILAVRNVVENDRTKIHNIINSLTGGWESWLQVEAALGLISALGVGSTAYREQKYPAPDTAVCDLLLKPMRGASVYVELKVELKPNDNILDRFNIDVQKLQALSATTRSTCVLVAAAFMSNFDDKALKTYSLKMGANLKIQQWDGSKWNDTTANPVSGNLTLVSFKLV